MIIKTKNAEFDSGAILTAIDAFTRKEEIEKHLNEQVYVSDSFSFLLKSIEDGYVLRLESISTNPKNPALYRANGADWSFCLPVSAVKFKVVEPKKEYRPFNNEAELFSTLQHYLGSSITYRNKNDPKTHFVELLDGYVMEDKQLKSVCFAGHRFLPVYLFEHYEWEDNYGNWLPFGVETKE